jgi:hypothetical protein
MPKRVEKDRLSWIESHTKAHRKRSLSSPASNSRWALNAASTMIDMNQ